MAYEQTVGYLDRFQLLSELQSGYREYRSTETATIKAMSDFTRRQTLALSTLLVLLDLSAAFDTVDHRILFNRLEHVCGIKGLFIQWIESYLSGQRQFVRNKGSPQTLHLSHPACHKILLISYSAEVVAIVRHQGSKVHGYADDLKYIDRRLRTVLLIRWLICM